MPVIADSDWASLASHRVAGLGTQLWMTQPQVLAFAVAGKRIGRGAIRVASAVLYQDGGISDSNEDSKAVAVVVANTIEVGGVVMVPQAGQGSRAAGGNREQVTLNPIQ
jgi:hypothetical protein